MRRKCHSLSSWCDFFSPLRDRLAFVKRKRCFDEPAYRKERSESSSGEGWKKIEEGRENWERLKGRENKNKTRS